MSEFLLWEDGTDTRHELVDGRVVAMAPPSPTHSTIAANLAVMIGTQVAPPSRPTVEWGVPRPNGESYFQADLAVVCGAIVPGETPPDPVLIVEITSPSTYDHDVGRKAMFYREIPACRTIPVVESTRRRVTVLTRQVNGWLLRDHIGDAVIDIAEPALRLTLADIYAGVSLERVRPADT